VGYHRDRQTDAIIETRVVPRTTNRFRNPRNLSNKTLPTQQEEKNRDRISRFKRIKREESRTKAETAYDNTRSLARKGAKSKEKRQ
jgi:hypothetical protein